MKKISSPPRVILTTRKKLFLQNITLVQNTLVKGRFSFCTTATDIYLTTSGIKDSLSNGRVAASTRSPLIGCLISQVAKVAANEILDIAHVLILQSRAQIYVRLSELVGPLALFSLAVGEICLLER